MWQQGYAADRPEWRVVETPFSTALYEVVMTTDGPYAVGNSGIIAANRDGDDEWEIILDDGPNVRQSQMRALDVTDDGKRIWFAGSSGAIGCYDVETQRKYDYSYPKEMTSTWEAIAVAGPAGKEKGLIANGSGEVLPFTIDGFDENWGVPSKPSHQGSTIAALGAAPDGVGYAVDTNGNAYRTTKEEGWEDIGIVNAQVNFYDIWAGKNQRVYVTGGGGRLYRYDDSYHDWTPIGVADSGALREFDMYREQLGVLGNTGNMYQRVDGGRRWQRIHTPVDVVLFDMVLGDPDVAVGKAGTVIRRPRGETRQSGTSADGDNYENRGETYDSDTYAPGEEADASSGGSTSS